jgi:hypothetical protein
VYLIRQGEEKIVVQAKRYTRRVSVKAVQEAVAAKGYRATAAESLPLTVEMFNEQVAVQPAVNAATTSTCARCGKPVSAKVHEHCVAHVDIFHGFTYCYDHQKEIRSIQKA